MTAACWLLQPAQHRSRRHLALPWLQQLAAGQLVVLESPHELLPSGIADPHVTQGLYLSTVASTAPLQRSRGGCSRQVELPANAAAIPCSLRFYSRSSFKPLASVPRASHDLAAALSQQIGTAASTVTLSSSRYGMLGTPAAASGMSTEAWLAGSSSILEALQVLASPPRQTYLLPTPDDDSSSSSTTTTPSSSSSKPPEAPSAPFKQHPLAAAAVMHPGLFCSSRPTEPAAAHISGPCRTT